MISTPDTLLQRHIAQTRQRLFWQSWLNYLPYCCAGLLLLAGAWLLVHPFLLGPAEPWLRWAIVGGAIAVGLVMALGLAVWRGPSRIEAALALDERFGLKERVTTSLLLTEEQTQSPAGLALLDDVHQQLATVRVGARFPLRLSWKRALVPVAAALLAALAVFFEPDLKSAVADTKDPNALAADKAKAIEKAREEAKKKLEDRDKENPPKSEELKTMDLKMKQLLNEDIDATKKDDVIKQAEKLQELKEENDKLLKKAKEDLKKKSELQQQAKDLDKLTSPDEDKKDNPAKEMMDAIQKGDTKKAAEEAKKLQEKLEKGELSEKEKKDLADQLEAVQKQAEKMAQQNKDLKKELEEAKKSGEKTEEQLKQLEQQAQDQQNLKDLAKDLKECQNCVKEGKDGMKDGKKAAEKLGDAADKLQKAAAKKADLEKQLDKMSQKEADLQQLQQNQKMLQDTQQKMVQNLGGGTSPLGNGPRPSEKNKVGFKDANEKLNNWDKDGQVKMVGSGPLMPGTKTTIPLEEQTSTKFKQTIQQTQQAVESQPISPEAAELLKGYYQNLNKQK